MPTLAISAEEELHWLALRMAPGLGILRSMRLIEKWKSPLAVFRASASELEASGLSPALASSIASGCSFEEAADQQGQLREIGARMVSIQDPLYPQRLRNIYDPPLVLFVRGRVELLDSLGIGMVGTRRPTPYGMAAAERLSGDLARAGLTIISGMARGIDTAAHKAALAAKEIRSPFWAAASTFCIQPITADCSKNWRVRGLMVSEFPMGAPAYPQNFPIRNRIVSGLSAGVCIVEGAQHSGSAITARLAIEQGREVFAVPGNITSKMSWGPNLLIKEGTAKLVQEWSDIVNELPADIRRDLSTGGSDKFLLDGGAATGDRRRKHGTGTLWRSLPVSCYSALQVDES